MNTKYGFRFSGKRALRLTGAALLILMSGSYCASTQTAGRAHYGGDAPEDESEFFTPLSENDNSLRKPRRDSRYNNDCRCDFKREEQRPTAWNQESEGRVPPRQPAGNQGYNNSEYEPMPAREEAGRYDNGGDFSEVGMASWYGREFDGKKTASGQIFDSRRLTAAHRTLPLGTVVMVRNMDNNKEVVVTINDRGPYVQGRVLDISEYGAEMLDFKQRGLATVGIKVLRRGRGKSGGRRVSSSSNENDRNSAETAWSETGSDFSGSRSDSGVGGSGEEESYYNSGSRHTGRTAGSGERRYSDYEDSNGYEDNAQTAPRLAGRYQVQVGVFSSRFNATSFKESLGDYGHPVRIIRKGTRYAVVIEGFSSRRKAESVNRRLRDNGYSSFIMR